MKQGCRRKWSVVEVGQKEAKEHLVADLVIMDKSILLLAQYQFMELSALRLLKVQ